MMAMRRCLMKLQNTGLCVRSNYTSGLLTKQHPHHHQLKLHGIRALSEGARGTNSSNPDSKSGSPQEHHSLSSMESEIEKLRIEMKKMQSELRRISELTKSYSTRWKEFFDEFMMLFGPAAICSLTGAFILGVAAIKTYIDADR